MNRSTKAAATDLLTADRTELSPRTFLERVATVFAVFDATTQDSGNVSYGAAVGDERFFVKTAGSPNDSRPLLAHEDRVALLRNAARLARTVSDATLPPLLNVIESSDGPMLVYQWVDGELVGTSAARRTDPTSAFARFVALSARERAGALDAVFRLHVSLAQRGWIASDFYDGSLIYDFAQRRMHVVDLDSYRDAPFTNEMGRMFGSTRFMAPEEFERGARIDERTMVFAMGRTIAQFLPLGGTPMDPLVARACSPHPRDRFQTMRDFYDVWSSAMTQVLD